MIGIKITLDKTKFIEQFKKIRPYQFSTRGLGIIFDYLENLSWDMNQGIEFDPIDLCCQFIEENINDFCINVDKTFNINEEDYDSFESFIDAVSETGLIIVGYCQDSDTIITDSYSWV